MRSCPTDGDRPGFPSLFFPAAPRSIEGLSDPFPRPPVPCQKQILASASTIEKTMRDSLRNKSDKNAAAAVGKAIAARAGSKQITAVHFTKPRGKRFHGKLKALIDTMREAGLPLNFSTIAGGREA